MFDDGKNIIESAIKEVQPELGVVRALENFNGSAHFIAIGKGAWEMGRVCAKCLGDRLISGTIITKYGHSQGEVPRTRIFEAGHPIPDEHGVEAARYAMGVARSLTPGDNLIFLISGGGSALFEMPQEGLTLGDIMDTTQKLLSCGASINEINAVRKRLSQVKGGKFARLCGEAKIRAIILSDVLGDDPSAIASGPVTPDSSTCEDIGKIIAKYDLKLRPEVEKWLYAVDYGKTPEAATEFIGSVSLLCEAAARAAQKLGYKPYILTETLSCEATSAGSFIGSMAVKAKTGEYFSLPCALIFGGETVVKVTGTGKGGRNQEIALSAAKEIAGLKDVLIFSLGSDGTDGPTDAAGGIVDGTTAAKLLERGISIDMTLKNNDAYNALKAVGCLIFTNPTGTNVNDVTVALIKADR